MDLLRSKDNDMKVRGKQEERMAKINSDLKTYIKKCELKEKELLKKDKELGQLENKITMESSKLKDRTSQLNTRTNTNKVLDKTTNYSKSLLENETRKKDIEIKKLKDLVKKTNMLSKDKMEVANNNLDQYDLRNFYDGQENDVNNIMSKDQMTINYLLEENHLIRDTTLKFYEIAFKALQRNSPPPYPMMLNSSLFQKPFEHIYEEVEMAFLAVINQMQNICRLRERDNSSMNFNTTDSNLIF